MRCVLVVFSSSALLGLGCATGDRGDDMSPWTGGGVILSGTTDETYDDTEAASEGSTGSDEPSEPASTSTAMDDDEPSTTDDPADAHGGVCTELPSDTPCTACSKTGCCTQLMACSADEGCTCYMTCVAASGDVFGCGTQCSVDLFAPGPVGDLVSCSAGACVGTCP